ncbi:MAG: glycosyl hydrolase [Thermoguttaceae bacterium]
MATRSRERLGWQLEQMKGMGVSGYQINYAHSDSGGRTWGLTYPSQPPLFSEDWWSLVGWFMEEAGKQGAGISLSDYTLGFGQGWCVDKILREHPEITGMQLRIDGQGQVRPETVAWSLNPMHPSSGKLYAEEFFGQFERRFPGQGGKGLNFFFSDELGFGVDGRIWSAEFADEFRRRKGYDITPELPALFKDLGPRTPKIRLDYSDVKVALTEEGFFKPVFDWHQQRGMIMGCDHGGRGRRVDEFGDYFRTQRWNQGPGADQPHFGKDLVKAKVASSIAHLYERPRVWLEGFYGSGWGTTSEALVDATFANFAMGFNLLGLHGMYYSTHGGRWEWAPPDNTFRMPYWKHLRGFMDCQQRLAYLLSQGYHRCDVAILYPVAPVEADLGGKEAVAAAFDTGRNLYGQGIDFDFIDFESVARAQVAEKELRVSGERYRVLVLPGMRAIRHSTLLKAVEFRRAGGIVLAVGALPEASDRVGRDDPELAAMVGELFPDGPVTDVAAAIPSRDYEGPGYILHRSIGPRDVYAVYGAPQGAEVFFRARGQVELWDPWTGNSRPLAVTSQDETGTRLRLPLGEKAMQLVVFSPGAAATAQEGTETPPEAIALDGAWQFELEPRLDNRFGDFHWPPTPAPIGAEARRLHYAEETAADPGWQDPDFDDSSWQTVTCGFGPRFWKLGPLPGDTYADAVLSGIRQVNPAEPVLVAGKAYRWQPYEFSWRYGIEDDCGYQGYHGLKIQVADEFIGLGAIRHGHPSCSRVAEPPGTRYYLWTSVHAPGDGEQPISRGGLVPAAAWLSGSPLDPAARSATLKAGSNPLLLRYDGVGRGWFVFGSSVSKVSDDEAAVFSSAAQWIWWPGETEGRANRYFHRRFDLAGVPKSCRLRITCDNGYTVWLNGRQVGRGSAWSRVQEYDVASALQSGTNVLAAEARNEGGEGGLIAELTFDETSDRVGPIATGESWLAASAAPAGWPAPGWDDPAWKPAKVISSFGESLWAKHEQGPPRLEAAVVPSGKMPWNTDLAMRWYRDQGRLPFDTRPESARPAGWYRFVAPPGLRAMAIPTTRPLRVWADGTELAVVADEGLVTAQVPVPVPTPAVVALRVEHERGDYGGAAFSDYLRLDSGPGEVALGDWSQIGVLETYSGGAWYRKSFRLTPEQAAGPVVLDLGQVAASAEVLVNGKPAGIKVAPPWRLDLASLVQPGENQLEILVCNTLANHYVTIPTHYRGSTVSGLIGPVRIYLGPAKQ